MEELLRYTKALVLLQLNGAKDEHERISPDILLSRAGFKNPEIATMLGRSPAAVQKAVERAKKSTRGGKR